jgi:hypothetical protein
MSLYERARASLEAKVSEVSPQAPDSPDTSNSRHESRRWALAKRGDAETRPSEARLAPSEGPQKPRIRAEAPQHFTEVSEVSLAHASLEESRPFSPSYLSIDAPDASLAHASDNSNTRIGCNGPVPTDAEGLPLAPCACGSRTFCRAGREEPWRCAQCARRAGLPPLAVRSSEWCVLPPSCRLWVLSAEPPPVWTDDPTKACNRLQEPCPDEWREPHHPDPTTAFDDAAHRAMRRDLRVVVQDLGNEGKRPGQIARMFGLKPAEVRQMLGAKP